MVVWLSFFSHNTSQLSSCGKICFQKRLIVIKSATINKNQKKTRSITTATMIHSMLTLSSFFFSYSSSRVTLFWALTSSRISSRSALAVLLFPFESPGSSTCLIPLPLIDRGGVLSRILGEMEVSEIPPFLMLYEFLPLPWNAATTNFE